MNPLFIIPIIFGYVLIGTVWSGIMARILKEDLGPGLPLTLLLWPLTIPMVTLVAVYALITGKKVRDIL